MAGRPTTSAAFPLFPTLPPELRNRIWEEALPDNDDEPALVLFRAGCWQPHAGDDGLGPILEFHHEWLDAARLEFPLAFVNREAHSIAVAWFRKQRRFTIRRYQDRDPVLVRPMSPTTDALYVDPSQCLSFCLEVCDRSMEPDLLGQSVSIHPNIKRIALPETLVARELSTIPDLIDNMLGVRELLVIVNKPPSLLPEDDHDVGRGQLRWEFVDTGGDVFYWNADDRRFSLCGERDPVGDGVVARLVTCSDEVAEAFTGEHNGLRIRPILAIQR